MGAQTTQATLSDEAKARLLRLIEGQRVAMLDIYDAALEEAARIHGRDDAPSVANIRAMRATLTNETTEKHPHFVYLCAEITGAVIPWRDEATYEPEKLTGLLKYLLLFGHAPRWWVRLLVFFGFDAWVRPTKL